jgi:hypothetical protein
MHIHSYCTPIDSLYGVKADNHMAAESYASWAVVPRFHAKAEIAVLA